MPGAHQTPGTKRSTAPLEWESQSFLDNLIAGLGPAGSSKDPIIASSNWQRHDYMMEISRIRSLEPDLFATPSADEWSAPLAKQKQLPNNSVAPSARYVLPNNLPEMIKRLEDRELDRLLAVVLGEQKRRGTKPSTADENSRKQRTDAAAKLLTISKINAVCAAFKAGITPSRIARQFGLSQADVRKALASNMSK